MGVYVVAQLDITDREAYATYEAGFLDVFSAYGGRVLAVDDEVESLEGTWPYTRTVILSFPSTDEMKRWYHSPDYQALARHRFQAARANIILARGLD